MNLTAGPSLESSWASQLGGASVQTSLTNNSLLGHYAGNVGNVGVYNVPSSTGLLNPLGPSVESLAMQQSSGIMQNKVNGNMQHLVNGLGLQSGMQAGVQAGLHAGLQNRHLLAAEQLAALQLQKNATASQWANSGLSMAMGQTIPPASMLQSSQPMLQSQLVLNSGVSAQAAANQFLQASLANQQSLTGQHHHLAGQAHPFAGQPLGLSAQTHALTGQTHALTGQTVQNPNAAAYYLLQSSSAATSNRNQSQQLYNLLANQNQGLVSQLDMQAAAAAAAASQAQQRAKDLAQAANLNLAARLNNPATMQYLQSQNGAAQLSNLTYQQQLNAANILLNQSAKQGPVGFQGVGSQYGNQFGAGTAAGNNAALHNLLNLQGNNLPTLNQPHQMNSLNIAALQAGLLNRNAGQAAPAAASTGGPSVAASIAQYHAAAVAAAAAAAAVTNAQAAAAHSAPLASYQSVRANAMGSALNPPQFSNTVGLNGTAFSGAGVNGAAVRNNNNYLATALLHGLVPPSAALPAVSGGISLSMPMVSEPSSARANSFDAAVAAPIHLAGAANLAVGSKPLGPVGPPDASGTKQSTAQWMSIGVVNSPVSGAPATVPGSQGAVLPPLESASSATSNQSASTIFETKTLAASSDMERISQLKDFGVRLAQSNMTVEQAIQQGLLGGLGASEVQVLLSACEAAAQQISTTTAPSGAAADEEPVKAVVVSEHPSAEGAKAIADKPSDNAKSAAGGGGENNAASVEQVTGDALDGKFDAFSYQFFGEDVELVSLQELEDTCTQEDSNDAPTEPNRSDGSVEDVGGGANETVQESGSKTEPAEGVVADRLANLDLGLGFF